MKRATSIIIGFYVVLTGVIACKKNTKSTDEQVLVVGYDSTNLNWRKDTFRITYSEETESNVYFELFQSPQLPVQDTINAKVTYALNQGFQGTGVSFPVYTARDVEKACKAFNKEYLKFKEDEFSIAGWEYQWFASISKPFEEIICLHIKEWSFMGGAHGNGFEKYTLYSVPNGKQLKLEDLFTDIRQLTRIAEKHFREQNIFDVDISLPLNEYGFEFENNQFALNDNFVLSSEGLFIQYNAYEIAPYAMGAPSIIIPFDEIKPLLKISLTQTFENNSF